MHKHLSYSLMKMKRSREQKEKKKEKNAEKTLDFFFATFHVCYSRYVFALRAPDYYLLNKRKLSTFKYHPILKLMRIPLK